MQVCEPKKETTTSKFDKEKLEDRIAKLAGGVAVIKVGAATETEMKYLKLKIEDAVNATKAAIEEGIVAGGGSALIRAAKNPRECRNGNSSGAETWLRNHSQGSRSTVKNKLLSMLVRMMVQ